MGQLSRGESRVSPELSPGNRLHHPEGRHTSHFHPELLPITGLGSPHPGASPSLLGTPSVAPPSVTTTEEGVLGGDLVQYTQKLVFSKSGRAKI